MTHGKKYLLLPKNKTFGEVGDNWDSFPSWKWSSFTIIFCHDRQGKEKSDSGLAHMTTKKKKTETTVEQEKKLVS